MIHQKVPRATDCCIRACCVGALWKDMIKLPHKDTCFLVLKGCQNLTSSPTPPFSQHMPLLWLLYTNLIECLCDTVKKKFILFPSIYRQLKKDPQLIKKEFTPQNIWKLLEWLQLFSWCELPERENQGYSICKKWLHRIYFLFSYINCILNNGKFLMLNINHALHVIVMCT